MCVSFEELIDGLPKDSEFAIDSFLKSHEMEMFPDLDSYVTGGYEIDRKIFLQKSLNREKNAIKKR